ncbi:AMP-binding protein [Anaeromicropila populeti]|uniref:Acyl-CoA synthetase (AMP-forming)/AMP-acid ligase II n=1 Tax=Anaeromicropila populeti TaxID=37658 RepID=A0A1I6J1R1_9FIRM|nr:AMP-binding protein [Anaeromicropila populeti]SFR72460.1 Acyl-CoA synthetase (AMP-forming)/AMP-acid ligase II [Anaeromicropila populeti]
MLFGIEKRPTDQRAFCSEDGTIVTYGALVELVRRFVKIKLKRALVFCLCENSPGAVTGYLGIMEAGCVPLLLDAKLKEEILDSLLKQYQPAYLWVPDNCEKEYILNSCPVLFQCFGYKLYQTEYAPYPMADNLALLLTTSGSTGSPKLVRLSRKNIIENGKAIVKYLQIDKEERAITSLPMQYTYGLSVIHSHLLAGGSVLLTKSSIVQQSFWNFFEKERATSLAGVPYTYELLKKIRFFERQSTHLHVLTQAGGGLSETLQKEIGEWAVKSQVRFYIMYGQTEATARMSYLPPEKCLDKPGSIGIPIPEGKFFIVDSEGKEIKQQGLIGELVYQGSNVSLGYAECRMDLQKQDERQGILETGDLARMDSEGYYYIVGRKSRFIKLFGSRISLDDCERLLKEKYPGTEIACISYQEKLIIFTTEETIVDKVYEYLTEHIQINTQSYSCILLDTIPISESGKIIYRELERYLSIT